MPEKFQKYTNKIVNKKHNIVIILYLDNIFIYINYISQGHIIAVQ